MEFRPASCVVQFSSALLPSSTRTVIARLRCGLSQQTILRLRFEPYERGLWWGVSLKLPITKSKTLPLRGSG